MILRRRKWIISIILCASLFLLGCSKDKLPHSVVENPLDALPIAHAATPEGEQQVYTINHIDISEIRNAYDAQGNVAGGSVIQERQLRQNGSYTILRDSYSLNLYFPSKVSKEEVEKRISIDPPLPFHVQEGISWGSEWRVGVQFDTTPIIGQSYHITFSGLQWSNTPSGELIELHLVRDVEPKLTIDYVSNPNRMITPHDHHDEFGFFQLPFAENVFQVRFTKPMDQQSAETTIRERLGNEVKLQFDWIDSFNLTLNVSGKVSDEKYSLSFTGALDTDGFAIQAQPEIRFTFIKPKAFYSFDIASKTEKLLYQPNMALHNAMLLPNKEFVRFSDQIGVFFAPYYDQYLLNMSSFAWMKGGTAEYDEAELAVEAYRYRYMYDVHFANREYAVEQKKELDFTEYNSGLLFSPTAEKVAIITTEHDVTKIAVGTRFAIDLSIYDVQSGQLIRTYPELFHDIWEEDGTDSPPDERYLHYKTTYGYWFAEDQILIEYLSEDEKEMLIGILYLTTDEFQTITKGMINPILSPSNKHFAAIDWETKDSKIFDLLGNEVATLNTDITHALIWSDEGERLLYKDRDGVINVYNVQNDSSISIRSNMDVAGWLDENTLLIYK